MARITFKGDPVETIGELPEVGTKAPAFALAGVDLADVNLNDLAGKKVVLNIFPSLDTPVCATSIKRFNEAAAGLDNTVVLCISADLPFAYTRFCSVEGIKDVVSLSVFRNSQFGREYGVTIKTSALAGLLSRAVVIVDEQGDILYTEQVPEIAQEPDYDAALKALKG